MGWEKICPKLKDLISRQATVADLVIGSITGVLSASCQLDFGGRWFQQMFCSIFFCIYLTNVSGEREKLKESTFPEFKVNWSQQLNQRTGLPPAPVRSIMFIKERTWSRLLIYMNHPFHLLTNTKYQFAHKTHPTHLQAHRFTEKCRGSHNWI